MKLDKLDLILDYIRHRWQCTVGYLDELSSKREFCLVSLDSIREFVHIVGRNVMNFLIDKGGERSFTHSDMFDGTEA